MKVQEEVRDEAYSVKCTTEDNVGNRNECSFTFVVDYYTINPGLECPVDMNNGVFEEGMAIEATEESPSGTAGAYMNWGPATATDAGDDNPRR